MFAKILLTKYFNMIENRNNYIFLKYIFIVIFITLIGCSYSKVVKDNNDKDEEMNPNYKNTKLVFDKAKGKSKVSVLDDKIKISISNGPVIYALYGQYGLIRDIESYRNNFMINKIKITNESKKEIKLKSCIISVGVEGKTYNQTILDEEWLKKEIHLGVNKITNPKIQELYKENSFYSGVFTDGLLIGHEKSVVLQNQFFDLYTPKKIDTLLIECFLEDDHLINAKFKVGEYEQKNKYIFPMKGDLAIIGGPYHIWGHRISLLSEFAFDVMKVKDGRFYKDDPFKPENHFCYGQDIMAPADGVVVNLGDGIVDNRTPYDFKEIELQAKKELKNLPLMFASGGNFIIIDHGKSEFSSFNHLLNKSVKVKKGDVVKQGQVIAKCGNSGSGSTSPHLHFQFMNNSNYVFAKGLPIVFENLDNGAFSDDALNRMKLPTEFEKLFKGWGAEFSLVKTIPKK
ncbi:MAG: M23 family metallopeptidase [Oligoflexia bacterium]|nr:M23 family metallopeptidase [Oligoflexia bacterium]